MKIQRKTTGAEKLSIKNFARKLKAIKLIDLFFKRFIGEKSCLGEIYWKSIINLCNGVFRVFLSLLQKDINFLVLRMVFLFFGYSMLLKFTICCVFDHFS